MKTVRKDETIEGTLDFLSTICLIMVDINSVLSLFHAPTSLAWIAGALMPILFGILFLRFTGTTPRNDTPTRATATARTYGRNGTTTIMSAPRDDLEPPRSDPFTLEELKRFDGTDPSLPIYVSIKGEGQEELFSIPPKLTPAVLGRDRL